MDQGTDPDKVAVTWLVSPLQIGTPPDKPIVGKGETVTLPTPEEPIEHAAFLTLFNVQVKLAAGKDARVQGEVRAVTLIFVAPEL